MRLIEVYTGTYDMAEVFLDGESVMSGNDWDFHPGCQPGITDRFNFKGKGPEALADAIELTLRKSGESDISRATYVGDYMEVGSERWKNMEKQ